MAVKKRTMIEIITILLTVTIISEAFHRRILVDTDVDTDDVFALLYLLKQNKSQFDLQGISINTNGWSDGGHAVNHVYDILFMMDRDNIPVGVSGHHIHDLHFINSTLLFPTDLGGFLPLIDQGTWPNGGCRYRQAIPAGRNGRLDIDTNFGLRRSFLPQGERRYIPGEQKTAQEVMKDAISSGPITIFLMGSHTNLAIFFLTNPELKKNVQHIYAMGGSLGSTINNNHNNLWGDDIGNLFPQDTNPYAEFNIFADPLAAYLVLHSGIPITLVPLDATKTIPVDENFFSAFEKNQHTFEAQYCFQSLKMARDTWISNGFYKEYCMWDSFMVGVALSQMLNEMNQNDKKMDDILNNEFALMEYVNITVITSNEPYGISDGSNPLINNTFTSNLFNINNSSVIHSGHVQTGMRDQFCLVKGNKGKCQDGYTKKVSGNEGVRVLIAKEAKPNIDNTTLLGKQFYKSFLDVMNRPEQSGRFNITTQFAKYREIMNKPCLKERSKGNNKAVVLDMDMSPGDFVALFYLLKLPSQIIDVKGILISGNGWANIATIDIVYDIVHMMGRDDIPIGLGNVFAIDQSLPSFPSLGDCTFTKYIPQGPGGFLDSDTLYGLARHLPRSPRTYTASNSVKFGAPRDTDHPEHRQPTSLEVWNSLVSSLDPGTKITVLTNGPLTNLAQIIDLAYNTTSLIEDVYIIGGHIGKEIEIEDHFTFPSSIFLDPLAANKTLESNLSVTLIPLHAQKQVSSSNLIIRELNDTNRTPELDFVRSLIQTLERLKEKDEKYSHVDMFLGEILGAVILGSDIGQEFEFKSIKILTDHQLEDISKVGEIIVVDDGQQGKRVKVLESVNPTAFYENLAKYLGNEKQSAVVGSFVDQKRMWSDSPNKSFQSFYRSIEVNVLVGLMLLMIFWLAVRFRNNVVRK